MNRLIKFGIAFSCVFMLAACERPDRGGEMYGEGMSSAPATAPGDVGTAPGTEADFVETIGDRVFFATDSSRISPSARQTLEQQAEWLKQYPEFDVIVEGHADERGTREYNLALGERRANAAKQVLVAMGIEPNRITTISYGKERPAVLGHTEAAWSQNRRAVTVLTR